MLNKVQNEMQKKKEKHLNKPLQINRANARTNPQPKY